MPQIRLQGEYWLMSGNATRDAELKLVGEKQSPKTSFSMVVDKNKDTTPKYANCVAWRSLANHASHIKKGDPVVAIGFVESREYNGKTYTDLVCDAVIFPSVRDAAMEPVSSTRPNLSQTDDGSDFAEVEDDDDLPF